jgi:hypothetical protein
MPLISGNKPVIHLPFQPLLREEVQSPRAQKKEENVVILVARTLKIETHQFQACHA